MDTLIMEKFNALSNEDKALFYKIAFIDKYNIDSVLNCTYRNVEKINKFSTVMLGVMYLVSAYKYEIDKVAAQIHEYFNSNLVADIINNIPDPFKKQLYKDLLFTEQYDSKSTLHSTFMDDFIKLSKADQAVLYKILCVDEYGIDSMFTCTYAFVQSIFEFSSVFNDVMDSVYVYTNIPKADQLKIKKELNTKFNGITDSDELSSLYLTDIKDQFTKQFYEDILDSSLL